MVARNMKTRATIACKKLSRVPKSRWKDTHGQQAARARAQRSEAVLVIVIDLSVLGLYGSSSFRTSGSSLPVHCAIGS